ncbi:hypothetical protein D9M72_340980 [compost metagenome]
MSCCSREIASAASSTTTSPPRTGKSGTAVRCQSATAGPRHEDQAAHAPAQDIQERQSLLPIVQPAAEVGDHLDIGEAHLVATTLKASGLRPQLGALVMRGDPGIANGLAYDKAS